MRGSWGGVLSCPGGWGVPSLQTKSVVIVVIDRLPWIKRGIMWVGASQYLTAGSFHCLRSCGNSAGGRDLLVRQKYQPGRLKNITLARIKTLPRNNEPTNPPRIKTKTYNFQCFLNISDVTASPNFILWYLRQCFCFSAFKQPSEWMSFFWESLHLICCCVGGWGGFTWTKRTLARKVSIERRLRKTKKQNVPYDSGVLSSSKKDSTLWSNLPT